MFKIGDFSKLAQVSSRMLRHYDQLGLLVPSHIDEWTGYRYYTIDQLPRLHRLIALKELGFSLEQVAQLLQEDEVPVEQLRGMLRMRQAELEQELRAGQFRLAEVEGRLWQIERAGKPSDYEIVVKPVEPQPVASVRQVVPHASEMDYYCRTLYERLYSSLASLEIKPLEPEITIYHAEEYTEIDLDVETAVVVDENIVPRPPAGDVEGFIAFRTVPGADLAAALIYEGPFAEIQPAILELLRWVGMHQHTPAGPLRELHLSGPAHVKGLPVDSAIVELQLPIARVDQLG
jgi:DNA-binding transcriptional MerR regulator/effector-binding domain-containing protein